ncbi:unnamed protein product [Trifolium pratense]|uniref:Uncharacterized protein n=1 Tax=Trifolium pratense TaxID=57577 RepID=A0ACB0K553_TRIPR|nr:unnamed protein product [Trifolium pratense]
MSHGYIFIELSSEEEVEEEEDESESDVDSDDESESDSEVTDEVFSDCSKSQLITALNKVIEKHLRVLSKQKVLQEKLNTLTEQAEHFQGLYQETLNRVDDFEKGCAVCHKPIDEQEIALQQFVHLNLGKSKAANRIYNVLRHRGEGLGYEYGRTYSKLKTFAKKVGKSWVYYVVPPSEEGKNPGSVENDNDDLNDLEADSSEEPSASGSGKKSSEDRSCSEPENISSEVLKASTSETSNSGFKGTSVPEVSQPKTSEVFKKKNSKSQMKYKTQIIYDSRVSRYNQSENRIDNRYKPWNHKQSKSWNNNRFQTKKRFQKGYYSKPRKGYILPKVWKQVLCKGRRAYVLDQWLTSSQDNNQNLINEEEEYWDDLIINCDKEFHRSD